MDCSCPRAPRPALLALLLPLLFLLGGCNIFSWTHDEGGSDDPETLLQDAEDALLARHWDEALEYARKGIELDPSPMQHPRLRYVAAQAVMGRAEVSIASYLDVFTNQSGALKSGANPALNYKLLDLSLEELLRIAESCPLAVAFLREILDALEAGEIGPEDLLGIQFDVHLGFGVGALLTAFITTLDLDQNLDNGFVQNPGVTIEALNDGGYTFAYTGSNPDAFIRCSLVFPMWPLFCDAIEGLYDAYRDTVAPTDWPEDLGCSFNSFDDLSGPPDDSYIIGQVLNFVHVGVRQLFTDWVQGQTCVAGGVR